MWPRTCNPKVKSRKLYWLSQVGALKSHFRILLFQIILGDSESEHTESLRLIVSSVIRLLKSSPTSLKEKSILKQQNLHMYPVLLLFLFFIFIFYTCPGFYVSWKQIQIKRYIQMIVYTYWLKWVLKCPCHHILYFLLLFFLFNLGLINRK